MGQRNGAGGEGGNGQSPDVARPRGATWRSLQSDGIEWEGQVLLVGGEVDLAARLIITKRRLALVRRPRSHRPAPTHRREVPQMDRCVR